MGEYLVTPKERKIMERSREDILKTLVEIKDAINDKLIWKANKATENNEAHNWVDYEKDWNKLNGRLGELSRKMGEKLSGIHPDERDKLIQPLLNMLDDFQRKFINDKQGEEEGFVPTGINALGAVKAIIEKEKTGETDKLKK